MKRKGGLQIGINTIVILVIAMVVIGGGIAFIRTFFKLGEDKLKEPFELADFGLKPSSSEPLVLQAGVINIQSGKEKVIKGGYFNKNTVNAIDISGISIKCVDSTNADSTPVHQSIAFKVPPNDAQGFSVLLKGVQKADITKNLLTGTYICNAEALGPGDVTQFTLQVGN